MKKLLLFVLLVGGGVFVAYRFGLIGEGGSKAGPPNFSKPETAAEYFFKAAMEGNQDKLRRICVDAKEGTLLRAAANLQSAIPPDRRGASFRWQNTVSEENEDQAYTGKVGSTYFTIGLQRVGSEYQVCRLLVG